VALAFVHHLAITRNVPLEELLDWIINLAPAGIIEFIPKSDPMVQSLLRHREDIFLGLYPGSFLTYMERNASLVSTAVVSASGRLLASYKRRKSIEPL
jgi:hypothetical protein